MENLKSHFLILCSVSVVLFGHTMAVASSGELATADGLEQYFTQVDTDEVVGLQETNLTESITDAMVMIADRLEAEQSFYWGSWHNEDDFTGSIVAGLVGAYDLTKNKAYKISAEFGGDYILSTAQGNFYGDEAFALTRLMQTCNSPYSNRWWITGMSDFYEDVYFEGTDYYISQFDNIEPSTAVFYVAYHVVAAYYVDAIDKKIWREALINYLSQVDDESSYFPVMAMGIATWALAQTGPLDDTLIDPLGTGSAYWSGIKLADLPELLLYHQVPVDDVDPNPGSFYWRFDHGDGGSGGPVSGYTEDAIFATLGLISAYQTNPASDLETTILTACQALLGGIDNEGKVCEHLSLESLELYVFGGEMLQVLGELAVQQSGQDN